MSLERCFPWLKLRFRLLKAKPLPFGGLVVYYSLICMFSMAAGVFLDTLVYNILLFMLTVAARMSGAGVRSFQRQSNGKLRAGVQVLS